MEASCESHIGVCNAAPLPEPEDKGKDDATQATTEPDQIAIGPMKFLPQDDSETGVEIESNRASPFVDLPLNIILHDLHSPASNAISDLYPPRRYTAHHSPAGRKQYPTQNHSWPDYYNGKPW